VSGVFIGRCRGTLLCQCGQCLRAVLWTNWNAEL